MDEELRLGLTRVYEKARERIWDEMREWNKVFQFVVEGDEFYLEFKKGDLRLVDGKHPRPTATLTMGRETLLKLLSGELDAMKAFLIGKIRITGNVIETASLRKMLEATRAT